MIDILSINEIQQFIQEDKASNKKRLANTGLRYYEADHDIKQFKAYYYNADGQLKEDIQRSNIKIPHAFFTELVDQKTQYLLSGDEQFVRTDYPELQRELDKYFDDDFKAELSDLVTYGSAEGFSYMYRYADENGMSRFSFADGLGIVEVPAKFTNDKKDYIIHSYVDRIEKDKKVERIQVWDDSQTYYYVKIDNKITLDPNQRINPRPHIVYMTDDKDGNIYYDTFGSIPFFRYDNNKKQHSDLKPIKELVDDYDLMNCSLSNNLESPDTIYFIKGMDGENLEQFIQNVKTKKAMIAPTDGDMDIKTVEIPYEARKVKMELDETNIYRFGMGLNTARVGDGNITNIVIKSRYSLLELKCNKAEIQLKKLLKKILKVVLDEINKAKGWDYTTQDVHVKFNRKILTNELDNAQIEQLKSVVQQAKITNLLNLDTYVERELINREIAEIFDWDYEEVQRYFKDDDTKEDDIESLLKDTDTEENTYSETPI